MHTRTVTAIRPGGAGGAPPVACQQCDGRLEKVQESPGALLRCSSCAGTWLTAECLQRVLTDAEAETPEVAAVLAKDGEADIGHTFAPSRQARLCPTCSQEMENHKFEQSGVWIDSCSEGHGVWLDKGELQLLARRRRSGAQAAVGVSQEQEFEEVVSDLLLEIL